MISDSEFELYVKKLQLPASAVELLRAVRVNPAAFRYAAIMPDRSCTINSILGLFRLF